MEANEWQLCSITLAGEASQSLGVRLNVNGALKGRVCLLLRKAGIPHTTDFDSRLKCYALKFDPAAYDDAVRALAGDSAVDKQLCKLYPALLDVLRRRDDSRIFRTLDPNEKKHLWANILPHTRSMLRPFQVAGIEYLWGRSNCGQIADEMGTGKSVQSIVAMTASTDVRDYPILVVCPKAPLVNWGREFAKWTRMTKDQICVVTDSASFVQQLRKHATARDRWATSAHRRAAAVDDATGPSAFHPERVGLDVDDRLVSRGKAIALRRKQAAALPTLSDAEKKRLDWCHDRDQHTATTLEQTLLPPASASASARGAPSPLSKRASKPVTSDAAQRSTKVSNRGAESKAADSTAAPSARTSTSTADGWMCEPSLPRVYIITYTRLTTQKEVNEQVLKFGFPSLVFDESQSLRSVVTQRTKVCLKMARKARRRILLSGTPGTGAAAVYAQLILVNPWMFPVYWIPYPKHLTAGGDSAAMIRAARAYRPTKMSYGSRYEDPLPFRQGGGIIGWKRTGMARAEELGSICQHYLFLRRIKEEVMPEMAPILRRDLTFELDAKDVQATEDEMRELSALDPVNERAKYRTRFMDIYNNCVPTRKWPVVEHYFRKLFTPPHGIHTAPGFRAAVLARLPRRLPAAIASIVVDYLPSRAKCLVFGHHQKILLALDSLFSEVGVGHVLVYGQTTVRQPLFDRFQTQSDCQVAVLGVTAVREGVNLDAAQYVYFAELYWDPSTMLQAEARAHRFSAENQVEAWYLLLAGGMDKLMWEGLSCKQGRANTLLMTLVQRDDYESRGGNGGGGGGQKRARAGANSGAATVEEEELEDPNDATEPPPKRPRVTEGLEHATPDPAVPDATAAHEELAAEDEAMPPTPLAAPVPPRASRTSAPNAGRPTPAATSQTSVNRVPPRAPGTALAWGPNAPVPGRERVGTVAPPVRRAAMPSRSRREIAFS